MARSLFCKCGSVYDSDKLDPAKLYKCVECGAVLSVEYSVDPDAIAAEQEESVPKTGAMISVILIIALSLLGVAIGAFKVKAKAETAKDKLEKEVQDIAPELKRWEADAGKIEIVDESEQRATNFMNKVFEKITDARKIVYPAVVMVSCNNGTGSGVIFRPDHHTDRREGYIVTNFHVVQGATIVESILSNQEIVPSDIIFADDFCDIAVIKLRDTSKAANIRPAEFGDSDKIRIGEFCMAMGAPQGLGRSVSFGIIVGLNRFIPMMLGNHYAHQQHVFFQMDSPINHGNSGGPLVSIEGKVIGMNTLGWFEFQRVGYAIASNYERDIVNRIVRAHESGSTTFINRSKIGVSFAPLSFFGMENRNGAPVIAVESSSPAYEAGLRPGDVVTKVRNIKTGAEEYTTIKTLADLARINYLFEMNEVLTEFELTWRNYITGEEKTATMRSIGFPGREQAFKQFAEILWGAYFEKVSEADLEMAGFPDEDDGGIAIRAWNDGTSRLENYARYVINLKPYGFQRGDLILRVCGVKPETHDHMRNIIIQHINRYIGRGAVPPTVFEVLRGNAKIFIFVDIQ